MSLILRRQPLNFPHDDPDLRWSVECDGTYIGVIVQHKGRSDEPPDWDWVMHLQAGRYTNGMTGLSGRQPTREAAMVAFRASWDIVRPAIGDAGWTLHVEHMQGLDTQARRRQHAGT